METPERRSTSDNPTLSFRLGKAASAKLSEEANRHGVDSPARYAKTLILRHLEGDEASPKRETLRASSGMTLTAKELHSLLRQHAFFVVTALHPELSELEVEKLINDHYPPLHSPTQDAVA